jgi:hypothetical protein
MRKSSHGETPFSLRYRSEAVIPAEIGIPSHQKVNVETTNIGQELLLNLDLLEERRRVVETPEAKYKTKLEKYYNQRVRTHQFKPGEYVLRSNAVSHAKPQGKLSPN